MGRNLGSTGCTEHPLMRESMNTFTHSHGGINILMLFEDSLSILQLLLCFSEQRLENYLSESHKYEQPHTHTQRNIKTQVLYSLPADLQILFHLSQRLHFVLSMTSVQQAVTAHVHPLIGTVVAQYLCVCRAPSLREVPQRIHQQVGAKRRPLQMGLEVFGTQ